MFASVELWFSDSDSEEESSLNLRRERRRIRDASNPLEMDLNLFIANFRLSKEAFLQVLQKIEPHCTQHPRQHRVPTILKLASALRFFAQGSYQLNVGNEGMFGLAQPTISLVLSEMLDVIERILCPEYISFEYTEAELDEAKLYFYNLCQIPGVIGAINGTHIKIASPAKATQHLYYNRKGFHSINAMVVCDHRRQIRYISGRFPGSSHDSHVFNMSQLKPILERRYRSGMRNTWLLGDAGYALQPYLMTPFRNAEEGSVERRFNIHHAKGRCIVERVIGILKNRWRCLLGARALHYAPQKVTQIISVCSALHNVCCSYNIDFEEPVQSSMSEDNDVPYGAGVLTVQSNEAEALRFVIAQSIPN